MSFKVIDILCCVDLVYQVLKGNQNSAILNL